MKIAILFTNIGSYHAARLRAAQTAFLEQGWELIAMQVSSSTFEHPWGDLSKAITFQIETVMSEVDNAVSYGPKEWKKVKARIGPELDRLKPDVVFVPGWGFPAANTVLSWCKKTSSAAVLMSESKRDDAKRSFLKEFVKANFFVNKFDSALVGGHAHKDYLVDLGMKEVNIFQGYDIVDNDYFTNSVEYFRRVKSGAVLAEFPILQKPYFLIITRMMPRKNMLGIISAYAEYRKRAKGDLLDLVICGSGEQEQDIRKLISNKLLGGSIHLLGFVSYQKLPMLFSRAAALIHPALQEQWGLVINEASASSLPILCSATVGAAAELLTDGKNGFLFDPTDLEDMINAMSKFHALNEEERVNMGLESLSRVGEYGPRKFGESAVFAVNAALELD